MKSWEEYFAVAPPNEKIQADNKGLANQGFIFTTEEKIYIQFSEFYSLKSTDYGGAIKFVSSSNSLILLIEDTAFSNCKALKSGGCIYKVSLGESVFQRVCGSYSECTGSESGNDGPFCKLQSTNDKNHYNSIFDSSISACYGPNIGYTMHITNGKPSVERTNMTQNVAAACSAFLFYPSTGFEPKLEFSTIFNNTATSNCIISFSANNIEYKMKDSNILYNTQNTNYYGLIAIYGPTHVINSVFYGNDGKGTIFFTVPDTTGSFDFVSCTFYEGQEANLHLDPQSNNIITSTIDESIIDMMSEIDMKENCVQPIYEILFTCKKMANNQIVIAFIVELISSKF